MKEQKEHLKFLDLTDEYVVYDMAHQQVHVLNKTAKHIHRLLAEGKTVEEIEGEIRKAFDVGAAADVKADVNRIRDLLSEKGLIADG